MCRRSEVGGGGVAMSNACIGVIGYNFAAVAGALLLLSSDIPRDAK